MRILVTGGAGFIGTAFVKRCLTMGDEVHVLDLLTYAGEISNIRVNQSPLCTAHIGDIRNSLTVKKLLLKYDFDAVVNIAAESHVDRSIENCMPFIETNVVGTAVLMDAIRKISPTIRFVQVSTDEVYGESENGELFTEETPLRPRNPYASSKAAADVLVVSYHNTYKMNAVITRCSNNYGSRQQTEKFIPKSIVALLSERQIQLHGDGQQVRDWIHVDDHALGIYQAMTKGHRGRVYNFGGCAPLTNQQVAELLCRLAKVSPAEWVEFVSDRPGNDRAYRMDFTLATNELQWRPQIQFSQGLESTFEWYRQHTSWWGKQGVSAFYGR